MVGVQLHPQVVTAGPIATADSMFKPTSGGVATSGATLRSAASLRGIATVEGSNGGQAAGAANGKIMANGGHNQAANNLANKHMNCALQYLVSSNSFATVFCRFQLDLIRLMHTPFTCSKESGPTTVNRYCATPCRWASGVYGPIDQLNVNCISRNRQRPTALITILPVGFH